MIQSKKRFAVHICNAVISLLCILSIAMYFIQPLWKADISYTFSGDTMAGIVGDMMQSSDTSESGDSSSDLNLEMDDITIHLSITLRTQDVLASLSDTPTQGVQNIIDENVNSLVDQLMGDMDGIIESLLKSVSKTTVSTTIKDQVQSAMGENASTEEVEQTLQNAGITDEYINNQTETLIDAIYADDATVDSVADTVVDIVDDVFTRLNQADSETFQETLSDETKQEIRDNVSEVLSAMADENGNLNVDDMLLNALFSMLNGQNGESDNSGSSNGEGNGENGSSNGENNGNNNDNNNAENGNDDNGENTPPIHSATIQGTKATHSGKILPLQDVIADADESGEISSDDSPAADSSVTDSTGDGEQMTKEEMLAEIKAKLSTQIRERLPEDIATQIAEVMKIVSYVLLFTFFTWAYLILKILVKLPKTNNAIKLKLPIWLGCIPFTVLYAFPTLIFSLLTNPPAAIADMIGAETLETMSGLSVTITSGSCFSFIAAVALVLLSIFYYGGLRRYLKKLAKGKIVLPEPVSPATATVADTTAETPVAAENAQTETLNDDTNEANVTDNSENDDNE